MSTVTTKFPVMRHQARRRGSCPVCGKNTTRTRIFENTVNPYNTHPDGTPLTHLEVLIQSQIEASLWVPDFTHARCKDTE